MSRLPDVRKPLDLDHKAIARHEAAIAAWLLEKGLPADVLNQKVSDDEIEFGDVAIPPEETDGDYIDAAGESCPVGNDGDEAETEDHDDADVDEDHDDADVDTGLAVQGGSADICDTARALWVTRDDKRARLFKDLEPADPKDRIYVEALKKATPIQAIAKTLGVNKATVNRHGRRAILGIIGRAWGGARPGAGRHHSRQLRPPARDLLGHRVRKNNLPTAYKKVRRFGFGGGRRGRRPIQVCVGQLELGFERGGTL